MLNFFHLYSYLFTLILVVSIFSNTINVYAASSENKVLAKVGQLEFTQKDFDRIIGYLPEDKQNILKNDLKQKARFLKALIEFKAIAMKAEQEGYDKRPDVREQLQIKRDELLAKMYSSEKMKEMPQITVEDIELYYKANKEKFYIPLKIKAKLIAIKLPSDDKKAGEAKALANTLKDAMVKKVPVEPILEKLANKTIRYKIKNVWLKKGMVPPKVWDTIKNYKKDDVSSPLIVNDIIYIIQVKDVHPSRAMTFEEARPLIKRKLESQLRQQQAQTILDNIMQQMDVTIFFDRLQ